MNQLLFSKVFKECSCQDARHLHISHWSWFLSTYLANSWEQDITWASNVENWGSTQSWEIIDKSELPGWTCQLYCIWFSEAFFGPSALHVKQGDQKVLWWPTCRLETMSSCISLLSLLTVNSCDWCLSWSCFAGQNHKLFFQQLDWESNKKDHWGSFVLKVELPSCSACVWRILSLPWMMNLSRPWHQILLSWQRRDCNWDWSAQGCTIVRRTETRWTEMISTDDNRWLTSFIFQIGMERPHQ